MRFLKCHFRFLKPGISCPALAGMVPRHQIPRWLVHGQPERVKDFSHRLTQVRHNPRRDCFAHWFRGVGSGASLGSVHYAGGGANCSPAGAPPGDICGSAAAWRHNDPWGRRATAPVGPSAARSTGPRPVPAPATTVAPTPAPQPGGARLGFTHTHSTSTLLWQPRRTSTICSMRLCRMEMFRGRSGLW